ncbi:MAG: hypothetical protein AAF432_05050 [Planctomycetota bacterium]
MPLQRIPFEFDITGAIPSDVSAFITDAHTRVADFMDDHADAPLPSFIPSDFPMVFRALAGVVDQRLTSGNVFCEWGSGFGAVAGLAALLEFESYGIEMHDVLVEEAERLATEYELPVEFACGTFVPKDAQHLTAFLGSIEHVLDGGQSAYDLLDIEPNDFDLVFCYPWPGGERVIDTIFDHVAANGAMLMTYHGIDEIRLVRKV